MLEVLRKFWREEEGQDLVEYSLIVALIALGVFAVFQDVRNAIRTIFETITTRLREAST